MLAAKRHVMRPGWLAVLEQASLRVMLRVTHINNLMSQIMVGTVTAGAGAPAAVLACNALQGVCMGSCAVTFLVAPTP